MRGNIQNLLIDIPIQQLRLQTSKRPNPKDPISSLFPSSHRLYSFIDMEAQHDIENLLTCSPIHLLIDTTTTHSTITRERLWHRRSQNAPPPRESILA